MKTGQKKLQSGDTMFNREKFKERWSSLKRIPLRYIVAACSAVVALICIVFIISFYNRPDGMDEIRDVISSFDTTNDDEDIVSEEIKLIMDFEELESINPDIYAWITIPGTKVDYPILRCQDDENFYLTHDVQKNESSYGAIYTQSYNKDDFSDFNTVLYGHNMRNGSMFGDLDKYRKADFFNKNQDIYIYQPNRTLQYRIFAAYVFDDTHIMLDYNFDIMAQRVEYVDSIYSGEFKGNILKEPKVFASDKIITLSTCLNNIDDQRFIVQGVLVADSSNPD